MYNIIALDPTATPLFASVIETPNMVGAATLGVVVAVQVTPPSSVCTIVPLDPTATPLFASVIETPYITLVPIPLLASVVS